ncbi:MAG TPA: DEAD/DEAH box helicase [Acidimicrobiales bacterium]|nr:DEAD/DEAH box helicase [Acidimicrobiales bacterium]
MPASRSARHPAADSALESFSQPTRDWFGATFDAPTQVQAEGWAAIARGEHALLLAPTGSGKTLAAFLWALDRLLTEPLPEEESGRCRVLYVSPLKALTYDVERNLRAPLAGIALAAERSGTEINALRVGTRTGDTAEKERRDMARHPPDILITTPESLYLILTSNARTMLTSVDHVIVDEVHAIAPTKRGTHMALSLERLERLRHQAGRPSPQRIGLSATQRPLDEIARFLGGRQCEDARPVAGGDGDPAGAAMSACAKSHKHRYRQRPVTIVDAGVKKVLELEVMVPVEDMGSLGRRPMPTDDGSLDPEARTSIWPAIHPVLLDLIRSHRSTLIFVNSRRLSERLANQLNELAGEDLVRAHHGSVAREQRLEIEESLKAGRLPALVATSSLELGIDMGAIDLVVQVESPTSVASGLQRIGRAGHNVGEPSKGKIFPKFRGDLLVATVVAHRMQNGLIEETRVPRNPLDVLAQQIVAMAAVEDVTVDEVAELVAGAYPFAELEPEVLEGVLDMLSGRYPSDEFAELKPRLTWDRAEGNLSARPGARMLAVTSGGTIPDRGLFGVFTPEGGRVGELDEEMVYESRVGETFVLGASTWRIDDITRDRVVVSPAPGQPGKMPFWKGDAIGRPYELGRALGKFLREIDDKSNDWLRDECGLDELAVRNLRAYIGEQREASSGLLPTDTEIVAERFRDELGDWRLCILSPFGARVHAPWALAIEALIRQRTGAETQAIWSDDGIVVRLPEADEAPPVESMLLDPDEVDDLVTTEVGNSAIFAARFRENAARALLLPRRRPGSRTPLWQQRQRAADLLAVAARYGAFPIILETYRECLRDVFDLPALRSLMSDIRSRAVRVTQLDVPSPSPFASSLAFSYVASFMYEGDAPLAERRAQALTLDRRMLAQLVGADELRELIDEAALAALEAELQALDERRWAHDLDSAHDLLRRLGDLSDEELAARSKGGPFAAELVDARRAVRVRVAGEDRLIAAEDAGRYRDALGVALPVGIPESFLQPVPGADLQLVRRWSRTHGPFLTPQPAERLGLPVDRVAQLLEQLETDGTISRGAFRPEGTEREWCDAGVLRQLRQRSLAALRHEVAPTEQDALVRFLPGWHGVGSKARGVDRVYEVITQLQGVPIPASVWERDVLASRVDGYDPRYLDELLAAGEVMWVGAGSVGGNDGRVMLFRRDDADSLLGVTRVAALAGAEPPSEPEHDRLRDVFAVSGACFFRELSANDDNTSLEALWDLVWAGEVTNDSFAAVRALSMPRSKRGRGGGRGSRVMVNYRSVAPRRALSPARAQGRWALVREPDADASGTTQGAALLARVLLERHGVLTRQAVLGESVAGGYAGVYPVLRAMEEAGRIRRGYFVTGLGGAQFALPGAVDRLRAAREEAVDEHGHESGVLLAATDPANPYGVALSWPVKGPARVAGAYVVLVGGQAALYLHKGGRGLIALREFDGTWEAPAVEAMAPLWADGRIKRLEHGRYPPELEEHLKEKKFFLTPIGAYAPAKVGYRT